MPELPEVEVIRRQIAPLVVGQVIERVVTTRSSYFFLTPPRLLAQRLPGRHVIALERRGKYLVFELDAGASLLLHLGMTGQVFAAGTASVRLLSAARKSALAPEQMLAFEPDEHTHLTLRFRQLGTTLHVRDVRKFGKVALLEASASSRRLALLGPDALSLAPDELWPALCTRRAPIKTVLLDQSVLAGVGNIYADEALHAAGIRPTRSARLLGPDASRRLARAIVRVLEKAIEAGGSSIDDYLRPDGRDGGYQSKHRVYGRAGKPCKRCGNLVERRVIAQRAAHFCPGCQR